MWAMAVKEFRQMRRDRRTLAMMVVLPIGLLIVFGYAASFDVDEVPTVVAGPRAEEVATRLPPIFEVNEIDREKTRADAVDDLRDGRAAAAVVTTEDGTSVLLDGSELFSARATMAAVGSAPLGGDTPGSRPEVLFNEGLETSAVMVPGLAGLILLFVGVFVTSLGVVRERQASTLEQLAVMPLRAWDVLVGKVAPYFVVSAVDLGVVIGVGVWLFDVPFRGAPLLLAFGALLFVFVTLGMGVLISTVSQTQGQAVQLATMTLLPQVLLSGLIFPVSAMAPGIGWLSYLMPLTYFTEIARGVMLRGASLPALWPSFALLAVLGAVVVTLATLRFRRDLAPPAARRRPAATRHAEVSS